MGKLDDLRRSALGNIDESMGAGREAEPGVIPRVSGLTPPRVPARVQGITRSSSAAEIPLSRIVPDPDQPREEFDTDALQRLADSLRTRGQLQPIRVRWVEGVERYMIVCGERRWRAAELAGLTTMSCVIMDGPASPSELLALQLVENLLREDLRPLEQARGFKALMDAQGWSGNQLAKALGIAQPTVVRALALLELPEAIQARVEQGDLPPATAYEVSKVEDPEAQADLASRVVAEGLSRAETVDAVRRATGKASGAKGRGGKAKKVTSRVLRTTGARVTVELRKGSGHGPIRDALREALDQVEAELAIGDQAAA